MKRVVSGFVMSVLVVALIATLLPRTTRAADDKPATPATGSISGKVTDKDGKPIEKAKVRIAKAVTPKPMANAAKGTAAEPGEKPATPTTLPAEATTDAEGAFLVDNIPVGDYNVLVNAKGLNAKQMVHVDAGQTATVELKLEPKQPKPTNKKSK